MLAFFFPPHFSFQPVFSFSYKLNHFSTEHLSLLTFFIWLNWSALKRSFLIGSLSGPNFPIWTVKMDRSPKDLTITKSCFRKFLEERTVLYEVEPLFLLSCLQFWQKPLENDITKIVSLVSFFRLCSARLIIETCFAVCFAVKSNNNKSFNELACLFRIEKILVSFFFWKF